MRLTEEQEQMLADGQETFGRGRRLAAVVVLLFPPALGFLYVWLFGVNVVYGDEWRLAILFDKPSLARLWVQLNEHRIFIPKVIILSLGSLTKWNTVVEMYVTQALLLTTLFVLFVAFEGSIHSKWRPVLFAPVAFLVFSLRQGATMLMGLLMQFVLVLTFAVLAFYFLGVLGRNTSRGLPFAAALAGATLASLSSAQGLLVWPVGLVQLLVGRPGRRTKWILAGAWSLLGVAEWLLYFLDYHIPAHTTAGRPADLVVGPLYLLRFFLTALGSSLSWWQEPAFAIGCLLLVLVGASVCLVIGRGRVAEYSFWTSLVLFSLLVLLAVTAGRAERGIDQALVSRYTTYSILGVVGLYAMLAKLHLESKSRSTAILFGTVLIVVMLTLPVTYAGGVKVGSSIEASREKAAAVLATYESRPDSQLTSLDPNPQLVRKRAPILQKLHYNVFSESGLAMDEASVVPIGNKTTLRSGLSP
jgi:hypothetical protein